MAGSTNSGKSRKGSSTRKVARHKAGRSKPGRHATASELAAIKEGREKAKRNAFFDRHSTL